MMWKLGGSVEDESDCVKWRWNRFNERLGQFTRRSLGKSLEGDYSFQLKIYKTK